MSARSFEMTFVSLAPSARSKSISSFLKLPPYIFKNLAFSCCLSCFLSFSFDIGSYSKKYLVYSTLFGGGLGASFLDTFEKVTLGRTTLVCTGCDRFYSHSDLSNLYLLSLADWPISSNKLMFLLEMSSAKSTFLTCSANYFCLESLKSISGYSGRLSEKLWVKTVSSLDVGLTAWIKGETLDFRPLD